MRTLPATLLAAVLALGFAAPAAADATSTVTDCDTLTSELLTTDIELGGDTEVEACKTLAALVADLVSGGLVITYQEVRPDGKWGNLDCIYDSAANTSVVVEWWQIWIEAGTMDSSGNRNPIVAEHVYYLWVKTVSGNAC